MAELKITTQTGQVLDLLKGTEKQFYVTRQVHDLRSLQTREADFTKVISLPATANNLTTLNSNNILNKGSGVVAAKVQVSIELSGIMIAPVAFLLHTRTNIVNDIETLEVAILYGNFNLFDSILAGDISDINWADLAVLWEHVEVAAIAGNETGICYAYNWWFGDVYYANGSQHNQDINQSGFWTYCATIVQRIIEEAGFTLEVVDLPQDYHDMAIACPIQKFIAPTIFDGVSFRAEVQNTADFTADGQTRIVEFDNVIVDVRNIWVGSPDWLFKIKDAGTVTIAIRGTIDYLQGHPNNVPCEIRIMLNGAAISTAQYAGTANDVITYDSVAQAVAVDDEIQIEIFSELRANGNSIITLHPNSSFSVSTQDNEDRTVHPSEHIPKINKKTFLTAILTQFNLLMTTDDITKVVTIQKFDDLYANKAWDFSNLLDVGSDVEIAHAIGGYYQQSHLIYANDETLIRSGIDYTVLFDNEVLGLEGIIIEQPYTLCDRNIFQEAAERPQATAPMTLTESQLASGSGIFTTNADSTFTINDPDQLLDFQVGDWIGNNAPSSFSNALRRIVQKTSDSAGVVSVPWDTPTTYDSYAIIKHSYNEFVPRVAMLRPSTQGAGARLIDLYQGGGIGNFTQVSTDVGKVADIAASLEFSEIVNSTYYKNLFSALQSPQLIKAWFNLPVAIFDAFDFNRPVYIDNFNAYYYVNKIEQFKAEQKVRIELIRISIIP